MIDITALQAQQSAEFLRPFRQTMLTNAHQRRRVVGHDGHPRLHERAAMAFVGEAPCSTTQQAGNDAFDHRSAVPTGASDVHLGWGTFAGQARFVQEPEDLLRGQRWRERINRLRDTHRENPLLVQRLT